MKVNILNKKEKVMIKAKFSSNELISKREFGVLEQKEIASLITPELSRRKILIYRGSEIYPLTEYLKKEIEERDFCYIMKQIISVINDVKENDLFTSNIILDLRYVYINDKKELKFIYIPQISNFVRVDIIGFMSGIANYVNEETTKKSFVTSFIEFIKPLGDESLNQVEEYLNSKNVKSNTMDSEANKIETEIEEKKVYANEFEVANLLEEDEECLATGQLFADEERMDNSYKFVSMENVRTGENIDVDKAVFRIGRDSKYSDYCIENNSTISINHADIISRDGKYFVCDQNSKEHTYVNGYQLPIKSETEVIDGDSIKLGNEEFIFRVVESDFLK